MDRVADFVTVVAGAAALAIVAATAWKWIASSGPVESRPPYVAVEDWEGFSDGGNRLGPPDAPVTVVEFGDYRCQYCRAAEPHLRAIRRRYGERITFVFRHFPLVSGSVSSAAARAAECAAEQGAFWDYHEQLLSSREWMEAEPSTAFARIGAEVDVANVAAFEACVETTAPVPAITADLAAAERLGIAGTPAFLVNDRRVMGVLDSLGFDRIYGEVR